jgi:hypothetical protein
MFLQAKIEKAPDFIGGSRPVNNSLIRVNMLSSLLGTGLPKNIVRGISFALTSWAAAILCGKQTSGLAVSNLFAAVYIRV